MKNRSSATNSLRMVWLQRGVVLWTTKSCSYRPRRISATPPNIGWTIDSFGRGPALVNDLRWRECMLRWLLYLNYKSNNALIIRNYILQCMYTL